MHRTLAVLLFTLVSAPASAQVSPGPAGPYFWVDDTGKVIGPVVTINRTALTTPHGSGIVVLEEPKGEAWYLAEIYFSASDCTGNAYHGGNLSRSLDGGFGLVVGGPGNTLYALVGSATTVTVASRLDRLGDCQATGSSQQALHSLIAVADLDAEFAPPFHIVTADSQLADVPLHFGWLIAGVLLGLGVKAVRRGRMR